MDTHSNHIRKVYRNGNEFNRKVSKLEGRKIQLPIAQIGEVLSRVGDILYNGTIEERMAFMKMLLRNAKKRELDKQLETHQVYDPNVL